MDNILKQRLHQFLSMVGDDENVFAQKTQIDLSKELTIEDISVIIDKYKNLSGRWLLNGEGHAMLDGSFNIMHFHAENVNLSQPNEACKDCDLLKSVQGELSNSMSLVRSLSNSLEQIHTKLK